MSLILCILYSVPCLRFLSRNSRCLCFKKCCDCIFTVLLFGLVHRGLKTFNFNAVLTFFCRFLVCLLNSLSWMILMYNYHTGKPKNDEINFDKGSLW